MNAALDWPGKTHPGEGPAVGVAGPDQSDQVDAKESRQQHHHHIVLGHCGEVLSCTGQVHVVGHHKEGTPEEGEVVTQTLCTFWSGLLTHLRQSMHKHDVYCFYGKGTK